MIFLNGLTAIHAGVQFAAMPFALESFAEFDDTTLVVRALEERDSAAIVALAMRYRREMLSFLSRFMGDYHTAEDVLQVADMKVIDAFHTKKFDPARPFKPWYYRVTSNAARDVMRKERRLNFMSIDTLAHGLDGQETSVSLRDLLEESAPPDAHLVFLEDVEWIHGALHRLSHDQRAVLQAVYFDEKTYGEAATELGIPLGTVKSRLYHAIRVLASLYKAGNS